MLSLLELYRQRQLLSLSIQPKFTCFMLYPNTYARWRCFSSSATESFPNENAYEILGVPQTSSFAEIKATFRELAKKTHPDLAESKGDSSAAERFIQILAAYEVRHLLWYQVGDEVSVCECRCCRAKLPPSKFWLFEPRCDTHDIGGWYIETFGRDHKGRTVASERHWDGFDTRRPLDKRLHPAMYLFALAYRTLDIEDVKRRKQKVRDIVTLQLNRILGWCKKLV